VNGTAMADPGEMAVRLIMSLSELFHSATAIWFAIAGYGKR